MSLDVKVGDYVAVTAPLLDSPSFLKVERETNTQWVCENDLRLLKSGGVHGRDYGVEKVDGAAVSIVFEVKSDKDVESTHVLADQLESFGMIDKAMSLRAAIDRYKAKLEEPQPPKLKPRWSKRRRSSWGMPETIRGEWRYVLRDRTIGTAIPVRVRREDQGGRRRLETPDDWRVETRYTAPDGEVHARTWTVEEAGERALTARRWIVEMYESESQ
jgi:hypothetical protein